MNRFKQFCWLALANLVSIILFPLVILWFVFQVVYMWLMERLADILWKVDNDNIHSLWDTLVELVCDMHDSIKEIFSDMKLEL